MTNTKLYKGISLCIKTLIVLASCWYIYTKVFHRSDWHQLKTEFLNSIHEGGSLLFTVVCVLMPLNWMLESHKWKLLIAPLEKLTLFASFKAVLSGIAVSTVTPNRAGEFAGRVFFLKTNEKLRASYLTFAGSGLQVFTTILMAALAFILFIKLGLNELYDPAEKYDGLVRVTGVLGLLSLVLSCILILLIPFFLRGVKTSKRKWIAALEELNGISKRKLFRIFLISIIRYLVFFFQFYFLLLLFNTGVSFKDAMILIPLTFFAITVVPSVAFSEIGLRGAAALLLFDTVSENSIGIVAAATLLWFINVAIPALAGCFFVFQLKFFRNE